MAFNIAVAGKGGVGKTTFTGMLVSYLAEQGKGPILAVDADSNANLNEVLGEEVELTIGHIKEEVNHAEMDGKQLPPGMTKGDFLTLRLNQAVSEGKGYDLLVMGRTQGTGCYCYVNGLLQTQMQKLQGHYPYIVVDNEAGMEHISRGILPSIDIAILVSDCSRRGVQAAGRIAGLIGELGLKPERVGLIVNRAPNGKLSDGIREEIEKQKLDLLGVVPHDELVYEYDSDGKPTVTLPADSPVRAALENIWRELGI